MTRYFPTLRGWVALLLAAFAVIYFPLVHPAMLVSSRGTALAEPVTPVVWVIGAVLIIICFVTSVEAFRRGTAADKVFACISVLLAIALLYGYLRLFYLPVRQSPNTALEPTAVGAGSSASRSTSSVAGGSAFGR